MNLHAHFARIRRHIAARCQTPFSPVSPLNARTCFQPPDTPWQPTHRHRKGGLYRVLAKGTLESNRAAMIIYDDADGTIWIRAMTEFEDGRFETLR